MNKKILITNYFSVGGSTYGDAQAVEIVTQWLSKNNIEYDILVSNKTKVKGKTLDQLNILEYDIIMFVCGPCPSEEWFYKALGNQYKKIQKDITKIGVDISIRDSHPFDYVIPRDFFEIKNPDLAFCANNKLLPVVGIFKVHPQNEYGKLQRHDHGHRCIDKYINDSGHACIHLNTYNWADSFTDYSHSTSNASQLESLISKCDYIISTRMHGLVYSLKCNTPVLAIDCIDVGAKVTAQAEAVGWPAIVNGDRITVEDIENGVKTAIDNKDKIKQLNIDALKKISEIEKQLINYLSQDSQNDDKRKT
jgi:hypothetical protein